MNCKVDGCDREAHYKAAQMCQKHYFRQWRYGTTETTRVGKARPRIENPAGYQLLHDRHHPLAQPNGYVFEHRAVLYAAIGPDPMNCELCGVGLTWKSVRVDHIDNNPRNNERSNLRPTCNTCNTQRGVGPAVNWSRTHKVEYDGQRLTPHEWSRDPRVKVSSHTIIARLKAGMTAEQALFAPKKTHNGNKVIPQGPYKPHFRIEFAGRSLTATEWVREPGVTVTDVTIRKRVRAGMPAGQAIFCPAGDFMTLRKEMEAA